jgi:hypothetical protein
MNVCDLYGCPLDKELFMAVGDVFLLDIVTTLGGQYAENVLAMQQFAAGASEDPLVLASQAIAGFRGTAEDDFLGCLAADVSLIGYRCRRVSPTGGNTAFTPTPDAVGLAEAPSYSSSVGGCLLAQYLDTTSMKYRTGRFFMPSTPIGGIEENILQAGYVAALTALCAAFTSSMPSGAYNFTTGVWSRKESRFYGGSASIVSWQYSAKPGTQRRRLKPAL